MQTMNNSTPTLTNSKTTKSVASTASAASTAPGKRAPAAIAREAIRQLGISRLAPTPENFALAYQQAAGDGSPESLDALRISVSQSEVLRQMIECMAARCPDQLNVQRLKQHVEGGAWKQALDSASAAVADLAVTTSQDWSKVSLQLLTQLDANHADWTRARKLAAVKHLLSSRSAKDQISSKLERLMASWTGKAEEALSLNQSEQADQAIENSSVATIHSTVSETVAAEPRTAQPTDIGPTARTAEADAWRTLALAAVKSYAPPKSRCSSNMDTVDSQSLADRLALVLDTPDASWLHEIHSASSALCSASDRQAALTDRLVNLLRLVCENLALFADDGAWVSGQVARISELLDAPLDEQTLTEAEESVRAAVKRQSELKADLSAAKVAVKEMLASLVDHLAIAATSTGEFHDRISDRARSINRANDLSSLSRVVADLLDDAVAMREGIQKTHGELHAARESVLRYEARVVYLEHELESVSTLVRIDPLTQVLNRRGLQEVFTNEQARADRDGTPLAVAILDIDNFKALNDSLGHAAGDLVLKHLSAMVKRELRPNDAVARWGGEEFVILLPSTSVDGAVSVMLRVQRQLTRAFFLHNDKKVLVTFSAGIAQYQNGDDQDLVIRRADAALYAAKAAGKNRVEVG
jgi:diguanylate cyclase